MSCIPYMTPTLLIATVAPSKFIKNGLNVLERGKICYKMEYYTLYLGSVNC